MQLRYNYCLNRRKVATCHARVSDTRRDWLHKESTRIIRDNQAVYVEDLCVAGLAVGDKLPLSVREWTCRCGTVHDRDINAARNILAAGRAESPTPVELTSDRDLSRQSA